MLNNQQTNSAELQQDQHSLQEINSISSSEDLLNQRIGLLENKVNSLRRQGYLQLATSFGLLALITIPAVAANWPVIAPVLQTIGSAIATAAPVIGIVTAAVVGLAAVAALGVYIYKHKEQIKEGFEKGWEKVKEGVGYAKDKVVETYEHSRDSLKRGASFVNEKTKEKTSDVLLGVANKLQNAAGTVNYGEKLDKRTPEEKEKSREIVEDLKAIFADKDHSKLVENILSRVKSKIVSRIDSDVKKARDLLQSIQNINPMDSRAREETIQELNESIDELKSQKKFINTVSKKDLHSLLTERSISKHKYLMSSIFSNHHDEIKEIISECREAHLLPDVNKMFKAEEKKANRSPSLGRKRASSLPESVSLNSVSTVSTEGSTAKLLNPAEHKEAKQTNTLGSKISSLFRGNKAAKETSNAEYQPLHQSFEERHATIKARPSSNGPVPVSPPTAPVAPPKPLRAPLTRSNSSESVASNASFSSAMSNSESADSFDFQNKGRRNSSPSTDSGMSSPGSSMLQKPDDVITIEDVIDGKPVNSRTLNGCATQKKSPSMADLNKEAMQKQSNLNSTGLLENGDLKPNSRMMTVTAEVHHLASRSAQVNS